MSTKTTNTQTPASLFFTEVADLASDLYCRWLDEGDYEGSSEYRNAFQRVAKKHGLTVTKFTKRPWGIVFTDSSDGTLRTYRLSVNSTSVSYKKLSTSTI